MYLAQALAFVSSLSTPGDKSASLPNLFDRFRVMCPASTGCITKYDSKIDLSSQSEKAFWAAVYRSNNNQPSVFVKDEFLQSMRLAVDSAVSTSASSNTESNNEDLIETPMSLQKPVAIACLRPSEDYEGNWVLDTMRCDLKKENTDASCDGGSEHTEAVSAAIDALLLQYLVSNDDITNVRFERVIRTKGTLVSGILLEERGFVPIESLSRDMATHVSSLDTSLEKYADRAINTKSPAARERALSILSHLGRLDREADIKAAQEIESTNGDSTDDDYDPWASFNSIM